MSKRLTQKRVARWEARIRKMRADLAIVQSEVVEYAVWAKGGRRSGLVELRSSLGELAQQMDLLLADSYEDSALARLRKMEGKR